MTERFMPDPIQRFGDRIKNIVFRGTIYVVVLRQANLKTVLFLTFWFKIPI